jgi:AbrB family looped-hinge helix DNA binding protein
MTIADSVWIATALLHIETPVALDFSVKEITERAVREDLVDGYRPGLQVHASKHCVANKSANPGRHRMLVETTRGRRRLFKVGDSFHVNRKDGKIRPEKRDLPAQYHDLVNWYDTVYSKQTVAAPGMESQELAVARGNLTAPSVSLLDGIAIPRKVFVSSAGAIVIPEDLRRELGIQEGTCLNILRKDGHLIVEPITEDLIHSLVGCLKGRDSLVEAREREHRIEK